MTSSRERASRRKDNGWQSLDRCCHRSPLTSTIVKRSSSIALVASVTSLNGSRSSGSKNCPMFDDEVSAEHEIIEVSSRTNDVIKSSLSLDGDNVSDRK